MPVLIHGTTDRKKRHESVTVCSDVFKMTERRKNHNTNIQKDMRRQTDMYTHTHARKAETEKGKEKYKNRQREKGGE